VGDVVAANMIAADLALPEDPTDLDAVAYNVGTGTETSVNRLADVLERVAGTTPGREHREARPGELRHSALDCGRLRARGWKPARTLEQGLEETYRHIAVHREDAMSSRSTKVR